MNSLCQFFIDEDYDEAGVTEAMDRLQDSGIISDNCVTPGDVYESDAVRAVEWLRMADRLTMDSTGKYARIA